MARKTNKNGKETAPKKLLHAWIPQARLAHRPQQTTKMSLIKTLNDVGFETRLN